MEEKEKKMKRPGILRTPNFVKNPIFGLVVTLVLFVLSFTTLLAMDIDNAVRPKWLDSYAAFLTRIGFKLDVTIWSWIIIVGIFAVIFLIFFLLTFKKMIKGKAVAKRIAKGKDPEARSFVVRFNILYFLIPSAVIAAGLTCFYLLMPAQWKTWLFAVPFNGYQILMTLAALGTVIGLILVVPVTIFIVVLVLALIIKLVAIIVGGVYRGVASSDSYIEAKTASEIASQDIKKQLGATSYKAIVSAAAKNAAFAKHREETIFPGLNAIDNEYKNVVEKEEKEHDVDFKTFVNEFQAYLAKQGLYYDLKTLRCFVASLSASKLILLQGMSGTGKTTLPRVFSEYVGGFSNFYPVQATWRDRSDILGYFSDFAGEYKESDVLKNLYKASYNPNKIDLEVLDEMNISRVEYYFADFLSIYEYPSDRWLVPLVPQRVDEKLPVKLVEGSLRIPENSWFIGTINVDDSTFTVTDKVYDRAIILEFDELNKPEENKFKGELNRVSYNQLNKFFEEAGENKKYCLTEAERKKFVALCDYVDNLFDLKFGNRIMAQIDKFLPVYVALGGKASEALDFMFARKILRKVDGRFENYIKVGLDKLSQYLDKQFGKENFLETKEAIMKYRKRFLF